MFSQMIRNLIPNLELLRKDLMHTLNTNHLMIMIKQFHSLTSQIQDGKQMYASFKNTMLTMDHTVTLKMQPNNQPKLNQNQKKIRKLKNLEQNPVKNSLILQKKLSLGTPNIIQLKKFQTVLFLILMISEILMDLTLLILYEIKVHVVHATQYHSLKWLNLDLSLGMVKKYQFFHHNT